MFGQCTDSGAYRGECASFGVYTPHESRLLAYSQQVCPLHGQLLPSKRLWPGAGALHIAEVIQVNPSWGLVVSGNETKAQAIYYCSYSLVTLPYQMLLFHSRPQLDREWNTSSKIFHGSSFCSERWHDVSRVESRERVLENSMILHVMKQWVRY